MLRVASVVTNQRTVSKLVVTKQLRLRVDHFNLAFELRRPTAVCLRASGIAGSCDAAWPLLCSFAVSKDGQVGLCCTFVLALCCTGQPMNMGIDSGRRDTESCTDGPQSFVWQCDLARIHALEWPQSASNLINCGCLPHSTKPISCVTCC